MSEGGPDDQNFDETLRSIAAELGSFVERALDQIDVEEIAESVGVDPASARDWVESAGSWLRSGSEGFAEELAQRVGAGGRVSARVDPLATARPHPLDAPTEEQGLALAALHSGRWTVEPGTDALAARTDGPGPSDALGLVRELRVRDWIGTEGELTLVGRSALGRWLDSAGKH